MTTRTSICIIAALVAASVAVNLLLADAAPPVVSWAFDTSTGRLFCVDGELTPPCDAPSGPLAAADAVLGRRAGVGAFVDTGTPEPRAVLLWTYADQDRDRRASASSGGSPVPRWFRRPGGGPWSREGTAEASHALAEALSGRSVGMFKER